MDHDELRQRSKPFRQGYGARRHNRQRSDNPYLCVAAADLGSMYAA